MARKTEKPSRAIDGLQCVCCQAMKGGGRGGNYKRVCLQAGALRENYSDLLFKKLSEKLTAHVVLNSKESQFQL